ncbi:MFS transporter [Nocardia callitridis]|uniref:MFS transporter n=1 Tax=Nocardia callitridis TaxID=648753 RepID=UPI0031EE0A65
MLFKGLGDLVPLYGLYALLFADHGLSTGQISSLFALWSCTAFLLEVPSGAWADTVSRRGLLVLGGLLSTSGFALWTVAPSYLGFAVGFVLWGISGALLSGTFEALLYDELCAKPAVAVATAYPRVLGHTRAAAEAAVFLGILLGTPLYLLGGYALVGWVSVGFGVLHTLAAMSLPSAAKAVSALDVDALEELVDEQPVAEESGTAEAVRSPAAADRVGEVAASPDRGSGAGVSETDRGCSDDGALEDGGSAVGRCREFAARQEHIHYADRNTATESLAAGMRRSARRPFARYLRMLRTGVAESIRIRAVRNGVLLAALLSGITAFDEYFGLLAESVGVATVLVPLLVGVTVFGSFVGSLLAGRTEGMSGRTMAAMVGGGGALMLVGSLVAGTAAGNPHAVYALAGLGFVAIGAAYGLVYNAGVVAQARLQDTIEGPARATVLSVSGLLGEVFALAVFGFVAVVGTWWPMPVVVAVLALSLPVIAIFGRSWLPPRVAPS